MPNDRVKDTPKPPLWKRALRRAVTLTGTASVVAMAAGAVWIGSATLATRAAAVDAPPPAPITTVAAMRVSPSNAMTVTRAFHGQVEAAQTVSLGFEQSGRLNVLDVDEGDRVEAGQVLARLDTRILMAERARLMASRDALDAQAELSRRTTDRQKELRNRGFASDQAVDNTALNLAALQAQIAEVDAAITQVEVQLSQTELLAPFDGLVGVRHVDPGAILSVGAPVLDIREDSAPLFRVGIDPKLAATISEKTATIMLDGTRYDATFVGFRADLDAQTRTRTALFEIETTDPVYLSSGTLTLQGQLEQAGYAVPLRALRNGVRGLWTVTVLQAEEDDLYSAQAAAVEVLQVEGDTAFVRGTLQGDAMIVPDGTHRLVPGDQVRVTGGN
ncbi:efflux RND transporter periplasmic adaptor subunit [Tateyamaria omphalii]|uniref:efflux RND transporter periplasmic adaptor subunit n=1 Tax=Tateyamaria omphalii TaxID=299262 RepID=UPI001C99E174|nr:efflux RND transporter periplasmic adaptor subunit [Tateyamaria omphalii]MBY5931754.1 efflux RND transporter periplasmic adaptor subunit [Tateyamaria omphalii]